MPFEAIRDYFDARAITFDRLYKDDSGWHALVNRLLRRAVFERFEITLRESRKVEGTTILDVGCGPGRYALAYARMGARRVVGVDIAPRMVDLAAQYAVAAGVADRCEFVCADFMDVKIMERFDLVLAVGVFDYLSSPVPFLRRMGEVSRGRVIATFPGCSRVRMHLRRARYAIRGVPIFFYRQDQVDRIAHAAGFRTFKLVPIRSSGTGYVFVGAGWGGKQDVCLGDYQASGA